MLHSDNDEGNKRNVLFVYIQCITERRCQCNFGAVFISSTRIALRNGGERVTAVQLVEKDLFVGAFISDAQM